MEKNLVIPFEVVGDDVGPDAARDQMKAQIDALSDEELKARLQSAKAQIHYFHVRTSPTEDGDISWVIPSDGGEIELLDLQELPATARRDFAFTVEQGATEKTALWGHWVREDLIDDQPLLAFVSSDDANFAKNIDIRPWVMATPGDELVDLINDDFNGGQQRDDIVYFLESDGDPVALQLRSYLEIVPEQAINKDPNGFELEVDTNAVREWVIRERPDVGWALINGASPS